MKTLNLVQRERLDSLLKYHELGEKVKQVTGNERKYGVSAVPELSELTGYSRNLLWQCRQFAGAYSRKEVERLFRLALKAGQKVAFSHFSLLAGLKDGVEIKWRYYLEQEVVSKGLSVRKLASAIRKLRQ